MNLPPLQMYHTQGFEAQVCKRHYYMYKVRNKRVYPKIPSIDSFLITLSYPTLLLFLNLDVNPSPICSVSWLILTIIVPCITFASHLWIQWQKCPPISLWTVCFP